jgi:hypothetical protein
MIEGGMIPRARVMDQHIIDRYLIRGEINLAQHQAAEYVLAQAAKAGSWPTGVNWSGANVTGGLRNYVPFGCFPLGRTMVMVKKRYGWYHAYILREVVVHDWDVSGNESRMECLKQALDWVAERKMGGGRDPLQRLRKVVNGEA